MYAIRSYYGHTYNVEAGMVRRFVQGKGLPYLQIETDYSEADAEQLKVSYNFV